VRKPLVFDIEGTIGDITFVRNVLFPYARERTLRHLASHWEDADIQAIVADARTASGKPLATTSDAASQFIDWIDQDSKITPLKALQGILWREGYVSGELKAHLYPDAITAFERWSKAGHRLYIYSSGSIAAQKLYLQYSIAGDLMPLFSGYFDTTTGPKAEAASYRKIATAIGVEPAGTAFFSDAVAEITAAREAGFTVYCVDRAKDATANDTSGAFPVIGSFEPVTTL
jgi:enolase-phosphatase E1